MFGLLQEIHCESLREIHLKALLTDSSLKKMTAECQPAHIATKLTVSGVT